ncbi:MAG: hypothetical protein M3069_15585 [Chloroflexota bacterium]|nr:hypothetical protein [Chloroflexota bacterium]
MPESIELLSGSKTGLPIVTQMTTPANSAFVYPVDRHGFVRQCAWCRRVADTDGKYRTVADALIHNASHGCCEACAIRFLSRGNKRSLAA